MAEVFAAVAEERDAIATEPPVDVEARAASWNLDGTFVAVAGGDVVGSIHVQPNRHRFGDVGKRSPPSPPYPQLPTYKESSEPGPPGS